MRDIEWYRTASGRSPVQEFLRSLTVEARSKVARALEDVRNLAYVPPKLMKKLRGTDELWEVRVQHCGNAYRLLCFFDSSKLVVLLSGFSKKTERVPVLEVEVAHRRRRDYLNRREQHG
jgi:phage-related protein